MRIYTVGCSFTHGDELVNPSSSAWPTLLGNMMSAEVNNDAISGGTNYRNVYRTIKSTVEKYDLYIVAWTHASRYTFYKSENNFEINFNPQLINNIYGNSSFFKDWGKTLYYHWHNELYAFKSWLQQIILLQSFLKDKNYIMLNTMPNNLNQWLAPWPEFIQATSSLINFDLMDDAQIFDEHKEIQYYVNQIDKANFYCWQKFCITDLCTQFKCGTGGHLLEDGHQHLANLIYSHVQNQRYYS